MSGKPDSGVPDAGDRNAALSAGGEMGALMRSLDWSKTPLGPISEWSQALKTTVGLLLRSGFPTLLWWGPKFVQIYNDAYRAIPGAKHPKAFGQPGSECWAEIWDIIGPMAEAPFRGEPATWSDDLAVLIHRRGFLEECHFKVAYSPVPDEMAPTGIGGVLATVAETTAQVYGDRQLRTLRELGARAAVSQSPEQACQYAAATLSENRHDVPFALFYLLDESGRWASLASKCGFGEGIHPAAPVLVDVNDPVGRAVWPLRQVVSERHMHLVGDLDIRFAGLPSGHWSESPRGAMALPLASPDQALAYGVLVVGLSPHRTLDEAYSSFFELAAAQVVTAIRNARAYQAERKRAEALTEIDRAKTAFFSNVSHEFRTPLTLMLGPTEDLLSEAQGPLSAAQRAQLELIHRNELRLHRLVNALLDFSRLEAHRLQATYEAVDLPALTRDLSSAFRAATERAGLALVVDCPSLGEPVFVDRDMWEKIVLNLLSNAFKFTFEGSIRVALRAIDGAVTLEVTDTGGGIPERELPRVFERFHRVEGTRARTHEGSGIGLALVSELVKLHGGAITVHSQVGRGTTFSITIPRGSAHLAKERIVAVRRITSAGATPFVEEALRWLPGSAADRRTSFAGGAPAPSEPVTQDRILVADDNADLREYLTRLLGPRFSVEAVEDGAAALAAAIARPPAVVLADVMMPVLDGFGLIRELRKNERTRTIPVIMLSARAGEEASVEGLQAGADDYLTKPFSARELFARVDAQRARSKLVAAIARQAALLDLSTEAVVAWSLDDGIEYWNPTASALYGFSREEALGLVPHALLGTVFPRGVDEFLRVLGRDGAWQGELVHVSKGGTPIAVESRMRTVTEAGRRLILEVSRDIRDRKAAEAERDTRMRELEHAVQFSEMFVGVLGHDLRNPLASITGNASLLLRKGWPPSEAAGLRRIVNSARRMARMIEQLLDFTRIRLGGGLPLECVATNLKDVVNATIEELQSASGCDVVVEVVGDCRGRWDPDRLAQLLSNLVGNACQHRTSGSPVRVSLDGRGLERVVIAISNPGVISPELQAVMFEPLRGGRKSETSSGLGLGLYITKQIAWAHGGEVRVKSNEVVGTEVTVELPRHPAPAAARRP